MSYQQKSCHEKGTYFWILDNFIKVNYLMLTDLIGEFQSNFFLTNSSLLIFFFNKFSYTWWLRYYISGISKVTVEVYRLL